VPLALAAATPFELEHALAGTGWEGQAPGRGTAKTRAAGRDLILVVTGVGPVNAALEMGAALSGHDISGVVNIGIAGSFDCARAPLGAAMAATAEIYPEYGVALGDGLASLSGFDFPQWESPGVRVLREIALDPDGAARSMGLTLGTEVSRGGFLTVAGVTGSLERASALAGRFSPLAESMEGFALALACLTKGVPFLEVRTVSNAVGERDRTKWELKQALAGLGDVLAGLLRGHRQTGSDPSPIS